MFLQVIDREFATMLAALRYWQRTGEWTKDGEENPNESPEYDIATDGGTRIPLDDNEIDGLCQRLNCGG